MTATPAANRDPRRAFGAAGEDVAATYLAARGYEVVARNWRVAAGALRGEIDLVCRDGRVLVFVEVKTRSSRYRYGGPLEAVTPHKQRQVRALAAAFLRESGVHAATLRFDVVAIEHRPPADPLVTHVRDAF